MGQLANETRQQPSGNDQLYPVLISESILGILTPVASEQAKTVDYGNTISPVVDPAEGAREHLISNPNQQLSKLFDSSCNVHYCEHDMIY